MGCCTAMYILRLTTGTVNTQVLSRDGNRCVLSGFVDRRHYQRLMWAGCTDLPDGYQDDLKTVSFFKRLLAVYSSPSGSESGRDEVRLQQMAE